MDIRTESIEQKIKDLKANLVQMQANCIAIQGAIQFAEQLLAPEAVLVEKKYVDE